MRALVSPALLSATLAAAVASSVLAGQAAAEEVKPAPPAPCTCPSTSPNAGPNLVPNTGNNPAPEPGANPSPAPDPSKRPGISAKPKFAEANAHLDENDEIAALEAIRVALTEVGDGGTYVWHRRHGRLSGLVQPTTSFKDPAGRVCRHIVLIMTVGTATGRAEGIACRLADGRWQLDG